MIRPWLCGLMTGVCAGIAALYLPLTALAGWPALRTSIAFAVAALLWLALATLTSRPSTSQES